MYKYIIYYYYFYVNRVIAMEYLYDYSTIPIMVIFNSKVFFIKN